MGTHQPRVESARQSEMAVRVPNRMLAFGYPNYVRVVRQSHRLGAAVCMSLIPASRWLAPVSPHFLDITNPGINAANGEKTMPDTDTTIGSTGTIVSYVAPTSGEYYIVAYGAQGGGSSGFGSSAAGGLGAVIGGEFTLTADEVLNVAVGGVGGFGGPSGGGGGGGTFVIGPDGTP